MRSRHNALKFKPFIRHGLRAAGMGAGLILICLPASAQQRWDVSSRDGLVTIMANAASAADLANAIGEATGVNVVVHGEPSTPLTADIVDTPLDKAIAELAPSHLVVREDSSVDSPIVEVVLLMPDPVAGSSGSTEFLPTGAPTDGVVAEEAAVPAAPDPQANPQDLVPASPEPQGATDGSAAGAEASQDAADVQAQ